ncbi:MAG: DNA polymerase III subunit delta [Acholeplasmataceae bacterium]
MLKQYLFYGSSQAIMLDEVNELIQSLQIDEEGRSFYDLSEQSFDVIYEDIISPPFFTDQKLIVVKHFELIYDNEFAKSSIESFFKSSPEDVVLILLASHLDEDKSFRHVLDLYVDHHEVEMYDDVKMSEMIKKTFHTQEITIDSDALMLLISRLSYHPDQLKSYLDKIITYSLKQKHVKKIDIENLVPLPLEDNVYALVDKFLQKQFAKAINMYHDLRNQQQDPIRILQLIGRRLNDLEDTKILLNQRKNQDFISKSLQISSGKAYYMIKEAKSIALKVIQTYIDQVARLDYLIKSGRIDKALGVELFLLGDMNHE